MSFNVKVEMDILKFALVFFLFALLLRNPLYAGNFQNVELLIEDNKAYSINDIVRNPSMPFTSFEDETKVIGRKSFWLRFTYVKNDPQKIYYLKYPYIVHQKLDLYYFVKDSLHHYQTGVGLSLDERNHYFPSLTLELPTGNTQTTCWLHVKGHNKIPFFFSETDSRTIIKDEIKLANLEFFLVGLSFLAAVFSLVFYFFLKDRMYLYYSLFSFMLIVSRLTLSGYIFNFLGGVVEIQSLKSILNLYAISYLGINLALVFYFHEFIRVHNKANWYRLTIYGWVVIRVVFLIIHLFSENPTITEIVDNRLLDLFIHLFLLASIFKTPTNYLKPTILAACSLLLLIIGNTFIILPNLLTIYKGGSYNFFLNLAGVEVLVFAITMAYRNFYIKREHDRALQKIVEGLKESERLKDSLNKELEIKVEERTRKIQENNQQIKEMYDLLQKHNIELKSEVSNVNEARVFQKTMSFRDFGKIFPDENACYRYLADLKWKRAEKLNCKKCGYEVAPNLETFTLRCGKCGYLESVTSGTIFQRLRFPILKCFYIVYRTSNKNDTASIAELAQEIETRPATVWTFRQKVITLRDLFSSKKKHKDGWSHLIEYSILQGKENPS